MSSPKTAEEHHRRFHAQPRSERRRQRRTVSRLLPTAAVIPSAVNPSPASNTIRELHRLLGETDTDGRNAWFMGPDEEWRH